MKHKIASAALVLALVFGFCAFPALAAESMTNFKTVKSYDGQFTDLELNGWYLSNVKACYNYNLVIGTSDTTYSPYLNLSIAEAIVVACRIHCIYNTGKNTLEDVPFSLDTEWYQRYVDYAINNGLIGKNDFSDYRKTATRAEAVHILAKVLPQSEMPTLHESPSIPDITAKTKYYSDILLFYKSGILTGIDDNGTFDPNAFISRAEAAAVFSRIIIPSLRIGYNGYKLYTENYGSSEIKFDVPAKYTVSEENGIKYIDADDEHVFVSMEITEESHFADIGITDIFTPEDIEEFYEIAFSEDDDMTVKDCKAQSVTYGIIPAYRVKTLLDYSGNNVYCIAIIFIHDSTLFEFKFMSDSDSEMLAHMADSVTFNGHNMFCK